MVTILDPNNAVADYVIQVSTVFRPNTSNRLGSFNLWSKGGWFGQADELLKFCPANGCLGFHSDSFSLTEQEAERIGDLTQGEVSKWPLDLQAKYHNWYELPVVCDLCGTIGIRENLPDSYGFNMDTTKIANRMAQFYTALGGLADIYMVRTKKDMVFQKAREELYSTDYSFNRYRKTLESARDRDCVYYPLKSIIKDTASGGDLAKRFKALLDA
tara:strand:+ start:44735 stop:45379 length:645 start_codon:yes stop_codon:yes gene_type:complete